MSVRAWLVRRKIRQAFRPKALQSAAPVVRQEHVIKMMAKTAGALPPAPKATHIEAIDAEHGTVPVRGEWVFSPGVHEARIILYMHGGAYVWGGPPPYRDFARRLSEAADARVFLLDYTLAPAAQCPHQIEEALAAYHWLRSIHPDAKIAFAGDSAGGGLATALTAAVAHDEKAKPAALALIAPWLDLTGSGDSVAANEASEVMLEAEALEGAAKVYAGSLALDDPRCSPLFADHKGFPPTLIQVSDSEILLSDSVRFADSLKAQGVSAQLDVWRKMHHVWHLSAVFVPESKKAIMEMGAFLKNHMSGTQERGKS